MQLLSAPPILGHEYLSLLLCFHFQHHLSLHLSDYNTVQVKRLLQGKDELGFETGTVGGTTEEISLPPALLFYLRYLFE